MEKNLNFVQKFTKGIKKCLTEAKERPRASHSKIDIIAKLVNEFEKKD